MTNTNNKKRLNGVALATSLALVSAASLSLSGCSNMDILSSDKQVQTAEVVTVDNTITLEQITKDVTYLASDELRGRDNFTNDIGKAADFIAQRFDDVGLTPATGTQLFKQHYKVQRIKPSALTVEINGQVIDEKDLSMATTNTNDSRNNSDK